MAAVSGLGDQIRDRGPLGNQDLIREADLDSEGQASPDADDFGAFVVACQGKYALGVAARPDRSAGWRTISYEPGPDDDIDAVFSNGRRSQELEVYCNLGRPVLSEIENNTIPEVD